MSSVLMVAVEMLAVLELIDRAAVRALGLTAVSHIKINLGMGVPDFHVRQRAGAVHPALGVQVFGQ